VREHVSVVGGSANDGGPSQTVKKKCTECYGGTVFHQYQMLVSVVGIRLRHSEGTARRKSIVSDPETMELIGNVLSKS
jgi:hypothetical protein